ncbi:MAG: hypothetical protein M0Z65_10725 [Firmicutes bacterium]|uniref:Uncharacterized protein n=1 Tax=Kroppenstedtia guangzhouensis TaxID=1274356 RepID=A0ABQ1GMN9_9BACL|nr:hypothetical protein [Kroppenstedtia guangzhouensis]EGK10200.1 hypothetical protein HMPREF9374_2550 [Desmospora sp. 8437]MDA8353631.1 hypothetical protein [Bacillota bacterium]GGA46891.1 hypothetical protein GCM10007416_20090 [Kroppenstedtia guangzhouensis]
MSATTRVTGERDALRGQRADRIGDGTGIHLPGRFTQKWVNGPGGWEPTPGNPRTTIEKESTWDGKMHGQKKSDDSVLRSSH